jgi:hypothetical protein
MVVGLLVAKHLLSLKPLVRPAVEVTGLAVAGIATFEVAKDRAKQLVGLKR